MVSQCCMMYAIFVEEDLREKTLSAGDVDRFCGGRHNYTTCANVCGLSYISRVRARTMRRDRWTWIRKYVRRDMCFAHMVKVLLGVVIIIIIITLITVVALQNMRIWCWVLDCSMFIKSHISGIFSSISHISPPHIRGSHLCTQSREYTYSCINTRLYEMSRDVSGLQMFLFRCRFRPI